jgi:hypothetical protein
MPGFKKPECLFLILLILSFSLSVSDVSHQRNVNLSLPLTTLIVNSLVIIILLLQYFGVDILSLGVDLKLIMFIIVLGLSFLLSLTDATNSDHENRAFPTIVLIMNSMVLILCGYYMVKKLT